MRGEYCVGLSTFLAFTSLLLLIFVHVSQINTSHVPRGIYLAKINTSGYGDALHVALIDEIDHLYTTNASAPLEAGAGLRQSYLFGLYSHCGYVNTSAGICANTSVQNEFKPYEALTSDMLSNYSDLTNFIFSDNSFSNDSSFGHSSRAAYWMLLLGTISAAIALLTYYCFYSLNPLSHDFDSGVARNHFTFLISTAFSIIGSIFILIGASIWTAMIKSVEAVNGSTVGSGASAVPAGIEVSSGPGLFLIWAAFATLFVSIVPYMISCCTFRG